MEDTAERAVCQAKDFTILSLLRGLMISVVISCYRETTSQCPESESRIQKRTKLAGVTSVAGRQEKVSHGRPLTQRNGQWPLQAAGRHVELLGRSI